MIYLYHFITLFFLPFYLLFLGVRILQGKEKKSRLLERFGISRIKRPEGKLIWFHAASIGESMATISLMEGINASNSKVNFLITTGTSASAEMLKKKLPQNAVHQFAPGDNIIFTQLFLRKWRPSVGLFIESEIWPSLLSQASKFCNLLLLNARMSDRSFATWMKWREFVQVCLKNFSQIIVQSEKDLSKFQQLGAKGCINLGNIKFANKKLEVDNQELMKLSTHFKDKKVIVAASTHAQDEAEILPIISQLKQSHPDSYFILVPRHVARKAEIVESCRKQELKVACKSDDPSLPDLSNDLYIADTLGELGLYYRLCQIAFIGGSFAQGGHSPLEPAHFGKLIIFGPDMSNAANLAAEMIEEKAASQITDSADLRERLEYFLSEEGEIAVQEYSTAAINFVKKHSKVLQNYLVVIQKYLNK